MQEALQMLQIGLWHRATDFKIQDKYENYINGLLRKACKQWKIILSCYKVCYSL